MTTKLPPFVINVSQMADFPDAVYIGRENGRKRLKRSKWHNPFKITPDTDRADALDLFRLHMTVGEGRHLDLNELTGKALACWCRRSDDPSSTTRCHGDVLVALWNEAHSEITR